MLDGNFSIKLFLRFSSSNFAEQISSGNKEILFAEADKTFNSSRCVKSVAGKYVR